MKMHTVVKNHDWVMCRDFLMVQ